MNTHIGCTLGGRIMSGNVGKNGTDFTGTPKDVTSDCLKAVIDLVGTNGPHIVRGGGVPLYEINITHIAPSISAPVVPTPESTGTAP
jgi:hypothetical protein